MFFWAGTNGIVGCVQICIVNRCQTTSLMLEVLCDKKSACWITFILQGSITFGKMCSSNCSSEVASIEQASFIESLKLSLWELINSSRSFRVEWMAKRVWNRKHRNLLIVVHSCLDENWDVQRFLCKSQFNIFSPECYIGFRQWGVRKGQNMAQTWPRLYIYIRAQWD